MLTDYCIASPPELAELDTRASPMTMRSVRYAERLLAERRAAGLAGGV